MHSCIYSTTSTAFYMDFLVNKDIQNRNGIEYCRKSTESEDRQAFSLNDQHDVNLKVAERYGVKVKKSLQESMSAKKRGRPFFNEMVAGVESGKYEVIICWALNRLARNSVDGAMLIELMDNKKLHAILTPGKVYYNSGDDKLLLQIEFGLAKKYSDDLGPTVLRGMYSKLKRGWYPGPAKPGYINRKEKGEIIQVLDDERFPLLRKGIEMYLEGASVEHVLEILNDKWGYKTIQTEKTGNKPLSISSFYRILNDSFYYGKIVWNGEEGELNSEVPKLVSEKEFWDVQRRLGAKGISRPSKHTEVPYRSIIKCSECGSAIITYPKIKNLASGETVVYLYAKCSSKKHCKQKHISVTKIEKQLYGMLANVNISKDFHDWFLSWLKYDHQVETTETEVLLQRIDAQIEIQHKRRNNLFEMRLNGEAIETEYRTKKEEIEVEIKRLEKERAGVKYASDDWIKRAEKRINYALYARDTLENGDYLQKSSVLSDLGSNFLLKAGLLCADIDPMLAVFKKHYEIVNKNLIGFELEDKLLNQANSEILKSWLGDRDSNSNRRDQNPPSCH